METAAEGENFSPGAKEKSKSTALIILGLKRGFSLEGFLTVGVDGQQRDGAEISANFTSRVHVNRTASERLDVKQFPKGLGGKCMRPCR